MLLAKRVLREDKKRLAALNGVRLRRVLVDGEVQPVIAAAHGVVPAIRQEGVGASRVLPYIVYAVLPPRGGEQIFVGGLPDLQDAL